MLQTIKTYYQLTKPGIIYGNAIAAIAGFLLASKGHIQIGLFIAMLLGTCLIIASACVFNNYIDRDIDKKMSRTKKRALVQKIVSPQHALIYATILGIGGFSLLIVFTNWLTVSTGIVGMIFYVIFYGIAKRHSSLGTVVGSIPGAMPPLAGYLSVTNHIDIAAILLFFILAFWQMPHFYAIGIYRLQEYAAAGLPILPVKHGITTTKIHMIGYMLGFLIMTLLLSVFHYTGVMYMVIMLILGGVWLGMGMRGFWIEDSVRWAKKVFLFSLCTLLIMCVLLSTNTLLP